MADANPAVIFWGPELTMIYNEPYIHLLGGKHPDIMGQRPEKHLAAVWDRFAGIIAETRRTGQAMSENNACMFSGKIWFS